jgi:hypothetical protein
MAVLRTANRCARTAAWGTLRMRNAGAARGHWGMGEKMGEPASAMGGCRPPVQRAEVARTFLSAGAGDFPVPSLLRPRKSRNWKVPQTRRLESLRYRPVSCWRGGSSGPRRLRWVLSMESQDLGLVPEPGRLAAN